MSSIVKVWWLLASLLLTSAALTAADTAPLSSKSPGDDPDDVYWDTTIANFNGGLNGSVTALTVYDGKLIVGGGFTSAGGIAVNGIAAWDGTSWSPLGSGMAAGVLTVYDNKLIAGGGNHIAAWDGSSWTPLGTGLDGPVTALSEYGGKLVAGYGCSYEDCHPRARVSSWDGLTWSLLSAWGQHGFWYYRVAGLAAYDSVLVVSIRYDYSDGGGGWLETLGGTSGLELCGGGGPLWVFGGRLFAATFEWSMGICGNGDLIAWEGDSCSSGAIFGEPDCHWVNALTEYDGKPIAGGYFTTAGGIAAKNIAAWGGSSWSQLGSGIGENAEVYALAVYDNKLIVGGNFATAGGKISPYLAVWTKRYLQCGDADGAGEVNLVDIVYTVNWMFANGPAPVDEAAGDYNCDGRPNIADAVYMVNYVFRGGPQPCKGCK